MFSYTLPRFSYFLKRFLFASKAAIFAALLASLFVPVSCAKKQEPVIRLPVKTVRIGILSKYKLREVNIVLTGGRVFAGDNTYSFDNTARLSIQRGDNTLLIRGLKPGAVLAEHVIVESERPMTVKWQHAKKQYERKYAGSLELAADKNSLGIINETNAEDYIYATAMAELGPLALTQNARHNAGLLKLMKIVIRSYLFFNLERHKDENFHVCDLTHCMYFPGEAENRAGAAAIREPVEILIKEDNTILSAYFHSTCGGQLTAPNVYWKNHRANEYYRQGLDIKNINGISGVNNESFCFLSPHFRWRAQLSDGRMKQILNAENINSLHNSLRAIREQGRVTYLEYADGDGKVVSMNVSVFLSKAGRLLGWNTIKSNDFTLTREKDGYVLQGKGLGHGVGLCQWGARAQIQSGRDYKDILEFYFPNAALVKAEYK